MAGLSQIFKKINRVRSSRSLWAEFMGYLTIVIEILLWGNAAWILLIEIVNIKTLLKMIES